MILAREYFKRVLVRDRLVLLAGAISLLLFLVNLGMMLWKGLKLRSDSFLPLHYNIYFGIDLVGPWYGIFAPAALGFAVIVLNGAAVLAVYDKMRFFSHAYAVGTPVIQLILLSSSFFILLLNS